MKRIQRRRRIVIVAGLGVLMSVSTLLACSSSDHPGAAVGGSGVPTGTGTGTGTSTAPTTEAGVTGDAASCENAKLVGDAVPESQLAEDKPPPRGGPLTPGMYVLKELHTYVAAMPDAGETTPLEKLTGNVATKNLTISGANIQIVDAEGTATAGVGAATTKAGTFVTGGTDLHIAFTCPTTAGTSYSYTADTSGSGIVLYIGDRLETYKRIQ